MEEFVGEQIEVEKAETSPRPVRFAWGGQNHEVAEVLHEWVDKGFGGIPPGSRRWYNRRHRRHYVVKDADSQMFEIYLDYANRRKRTWWLLYRLA